MLPKIYHFCYTVAAQLVATDPSLLSNRDHIIQTYNCPVLRCGFGPSRFDDIAYTVLCRRELTCDFMYYYCNYLLLFGFLLFNID